MWNGRNSSAIYRLKRGECAANLCRLHGAQILCGEHFLSVRRTFGEILNAIKCCRGSSPNLCRLCGEQILCGELQYAFGILALLVLIFSWSLPWTLFLYTFNPFFIFGDGLLHFWSLYLFLTWNTQYTHKCINVYLFAQFI